MTVDLPSGKQAKIWISFGEEKPTFKDDITYPVRRTVSIEVCIEDKVYKGKSTCSFLDQFRRDTGRKVALVKLIKAHPEAFDKKDRTALFQKICPKFFRNKKAKV